MGYLKAHSNSRLIFDPKKPDVSNCGFKKYSKSDWGAEYDGAEELILWMPLRLWGSLYYYECL
jgi:hypothetical protein